MRISFPLSKVNEIHLRSLEKFRIARQISRSGKQAMPPGDRFRLVYSLLYSANPRNAFNHFVRISCS